MPYNREQWSKRIAERMDISTGVVHLTREKLDNNKKLSSIEVLFKILCEKKLIGSSNETGFIIGSIPAVCFQESPLPALSQNVYFEQKYRKTNTSVKIRYRANGLLLNKPTVFKAGGRPVIYEQTDIAKAFLPESEWWRIVKLDLSNDQSFVDWSHEREWRVPGDFSFKLSDITILLVNKQQYRKFINLCEKAKRLDIIKEVEGIVVLSSLLY